MLDDNGDGIVDKEEFFEAVEAEREMRVAFAGATKRQFLADFRRAETEKPGKISWYEFVAWVDKRLSHAGSRKAD